MMSTKILKCCFLICFLSHMKANNSLQQRTLWEHLWKHSYIVNWTTVMLYCLEHLIFSEMVAILQLIYLGLKLNAVTKSCSFLWCTISFSRLSSLWASGCMVWVLQKSASLWKCLSLTTVILSSSQKYIHCVSKKVPTFKLSVTLSNVNRFSKCFHCWKAY